MPTLTIHTGAATLTLRPYAGAAQPGTMVGGYAAPKSAAYGGTLTPAPSVMAGGYAPPKSVVYGGAWVDAEQMAGGYAPPKAIAYGGEVVESAEVTALSAAPFTTGADPVFTFALSGESGAVYDQVELLAEGTRLVIGTPAEITSPYTYDTDAAGALEFDAGPIRFTLRLLLSGSEVASRDLDMHVGYALDGGYAPPKATAYGGDMVASGVPDAINDLAIETYPAAISDLAIVTY